jgi:hypothetical protein
VLFQYVIGGSDVKRVDVINDLGVLAFVSYGFLRPRLKYASYDRSAHHEVYLAKMSWNFDFSKIKILRIFMLNVLKL